jgi:hypothetical protein
VKELIREAVEFHLEGMHARRSHRRAQRAVNLLLLLPKVALDMTSQNWDNDQSATAERSR